MFKNISSNVCQLSLELKTFLKIAMNIRRGVLNIP